MRGYGAPSSGSADQVPTVAPKWAPARTTRGHSLSTTAPLLRLLDALHGRERPPEQRWTRPGQDVTYGVRGRRRTGLRELSGHHRFVDSAPWRGQGPR